MNDIFGEEPKGKIATVSVGDDLYGVSVSELRQRVSVLKAEIHRTEAALLKKERELSEAETLFAPKRTE